MTRRCKPGQRARIIGNGKNIGCIVVVVRYHFGETVSGCTWPQPIFPWVVASLGGPLRNFCLLTGRETTPKMVIVVDDSDLEPLDDDDDGLGLATSTDLPVAASPKPQRVLDGST